MKLFSRNKLAPFKLCDLIVFVFFAFVCFLLFSHDDIVSTGEHSLLYLKGHVADFYSASHDLVGRYFANYLPSTFIVFAIWNIPVLLMGELPELWHTSSQLQVFWYKLLPVIVLVLCGVVLFRLLTNDLNFSKKNSRIALYAFISSPITFFSQFIFAQYDCFTVFFMLLGLYYYFKPEAKRSDDLKFILYFGIAMTFKYFAFPIFAVLLILRTKKWWGVIWRMVMATLPILLECSFYLFTDRMAFINSVFKFDVLGYTQAAVFSLSFASVGILPVFIGCILVLAYFLTPANREEWIKYSFFLCSGICFALFGLMRWHPQWLIFGVIFWVISACIHQDSKVFWALDMVFIVAFYAFTINTWSGNVDESLLGRGILYNFLYNKSAINQAISMSNLFVVNNISLWFTILFFILLCAFLFKHPKYCVKPMSSIELIKEIPILRLRFLVGVLAFLIPALCCIPSMLNQPNLLWHNDYPSSPIEVRDTTTVSQLCTVRGQTMSGVQFYVNDVDVGDKDKLFFCIRNTQNNQTLTSGEMILAGLKADSWSTVLFDPIPLESVQSVYLDIWADFDDVDNTLYLWTSAENGLHAENGLKVDSIGLGNDLCMRLFGCV